MRGPDATYNRCGSRSYRSCSGCSVATETCSDKLHVHLAKLPSQRLFNIHICFCWCCWKQCVDPHWQKREAASANSKCDCEEGQKKQKPKQTALRHFLCERKCLCLSSGWASDVSPRDIRQPDSLELPLVCFNCPRFVQCHVNVFFFHTVFIPDILIK